MLKKKLTYLIFLLILAACQSGQKQNTQISGFGDFKPTKESSKPWIYWYWMQSAYSKKGIKADLIAMKEAGLEGAYLMSIKGPTDPPLIDPPILQLSPKWWEMVGYAFEQADSLGLKLAMQDCDGFATAGGPWVTPELSMQKVVWSDTIVEGGKAKALALKEPEHYKDYYRDIATYAIPVKNVFRNSFNIQPKITSSLKNKTVSFLSDPSKSGNFKLYEKGWVQFQFKKPFTCRSIVIHTKGNNYQAQRLRLEVSNDGKNFKNIGRLKAPRHGWQDTDANYTHSVKPVTATYFRLVYDPEGTEPGAEDLDAAKWKQALKVQAIELSEKPKIDAFEGKSGLVWRIAPATTKSELPDSLCVAKSNMINISEKVDSVGKLTWKIPEGKWRILRFGYTSTGHENGTAGGGKGLEVDKFNPDAVRLQYKKWFGHAANLADSLGVSDVLRILHIDSWEAGSQNWSPVFRKEFKKRRGYDIVDYLPVMAGIPVESAKTSEQILHDVRQTISELVTDNFFGTMAAEAKKTGVKFSAENVAPTMVADGLLHFKKVDYPAGEFWLRSPTHDKPNDMLDAISAGHIYNKAIIQAEAFTELRMSWDEHPGNLKTLADRNYALGINRFFFHVFVHNPWPDRKPGMTLDGVGTYFQRNQTWWKPGKAWMNYCQRVQFQLQKGLPVVDLAVFTGEELPSRAILPDRLVPFIPNIFGEERIASEKLRLENMDQPTAKMPKEVTYSKNVTGLGDWVNAMNGYKYDSFNPDALLNDAKVENGKVIFSNGISYKALLFPGSRKMSPNLMMSLPIAEKIVHLVEEGATVLVGEKPLRIPGFLEDERQDQWQGLIDKIWKGSQLSASKKTITSWQLGKGKVNQLPFYDPDFTKIGIEPDVLFPDLKGNDFETFAWAHRSTDKEEIYFLSNQKEKEQTVSVSFRVSGKIPYRYNPVTNDTLELNQWNVENGRTIIPLGFAENESCFIIFNAKTEKKKVEKGTNRQTFESLKTLTGSWNIQFDPAFHGPQKPVKTDSLFDWSKAKNDSIKYYSGTAVYSLKFDWERQTDNIWLDLGDLANIAEVTLNGKYCGTVWTFPHKISVSKALKKGENRLQIKVTNTWANRLIGDEKLPEKERLTWTTAPFRLDGEPLLKAGLFGPVQLIKESKNNSK